MDDSKPPIQYEDEHPRLRSRQKSINDVWLDLPVDTKIEHEDVESCSTQTTSATAQRNLQAVWVLGVLLLLVGYFGQSTALQDSREAPLLQALRVNPNTASLAELQLLKGVGEVTAAKIVAERESGGPYQAADDLQRVSGIGLKTVEKLRDSLTFSEQHD